MVIAKSQWFKRKKGGSFSYGLSWQGTIYLIVAISVLLSGILLSQSLIINLLVIAMFLFLFTDAMTASWRSMDEREKMHYSIAMRNTSWGMIMVMVIISVILSGFGDIKANLSILFIVTALIGGIINILTRYKLDKES